MPGSGSLLRPPGRAAPSQSAAHTGAAFLLPPLLCHLLTGPGSRLFATCLQAISKSIVRSGRQSHKPWGSLAAGPFPFAGGGSSAAAMHRPELHEPMRKASELEGCLVLPTAILEAGASSISTCCESGSQEDRGELRSASLVPERFSPSCTAAFPQKCRDLATSHHELHRRSS